MVSTISWVVSQRKRYKCLLEYPYSFQEAGTRDWWVGDRGSLRSQWGPQSGGCRVLSLTSYMNWKRIEGLEGDDPPVECIEYSSYQLVLRYTPSTALRHLNFGLSHPNLRLLPNSTALCKYLIALALEWLKFKSQALLTTWMSSRVATIQGT